MKRNTGFTLVELLITMAVMVILLILVVVSLRSNEASARDEERKTDVSSIAQQLETFYESNQSSPGQYPGTNDINTEKIRVFGTKHVEIHSVDLRNPDKRRKKYLEVFNITAEQLNEFIEAFWYGIFQEYKAAIRIQAVIVDKRYYKNQRPENTPLMLASQALFDRVELHPNRSCKIIFDQMESEIKSVKHEQGKILKVSSKEIDLHSFHEKYSHTSVDFEASCNSNFLQLADTVAYNVLRQFVDHGDTWEQLGWGNLYAYFERVMPNMHTSLHSGEIKGYGVAKLPDPDRAKN